MSGEDLLPRRIASWLRAAVPGGVAVAVGRVGPTAPFDAREAAAVAGAVARRRAAFATGRQLARAALAELGCRPCALPPDGDGVPQWPAGFVGTISHADGLCIALAGQAAALLGIGVDIELAARVVPALQRLVCRPEEGRPGEDSDLALCFAAKEAVFKACFPATRRMLGFQDVQLSVPPSPGPFVARLVAPAKPGPGGGRRVCGQSARIGAHVVAAGWLPAAAASPVAA